MKLAFYRQKGYLKNYYNYTRCYNKFCCRNDTRKATSTFGNKIKCLNTILDIKGPVTLDYPFSLINIAFKLDKVDFVPV